MFGDFSVFSGLAGSDFLATFRVGRSIARTAPGSSADFLVTGPRGGAD